MHDAAIKNFYAIVSHSTAGTHDARPQIWHSGYLAPCFPSKDAGDSLFHWLVEPCLEISMKYAWTIARRCRGTGACCATAVARSSQRRHHGTPMTGRRVRSMGPLAYSYRGAVAGCIRCRPGSVPMGSL